MSGREKKEKRDVTFNFSDFPEIRATVEDFFNVKEAQDHAYKFYLEFNKLCSVRGAVPNKHLPDFIRSFDQNDWEIVVRSGNKKSKKPFVLDQNTSIKLLLSLHLMDLNRFDVSSPTKVLKKFNSLAKKYLFEPLKECGYVQSPSELDQFLWEILSLTTGIDAGTRSFSSFYRNNRD